MSNDDHDISGKVLLDKMLADDFKIIDAKGNDFLSPEGSLGLLALGYKGIVAWRKLRKQKGYHSGTEIISK